MDDSLIAKISKEWNVSSETIQRYTSFFDDSIKPIIKLNYLSHLVNTIENMVNDKKLNNVLKQAELKNISTEKIKYLYIKETLRFYSIILVPATLKRRATTRYHNSGAIIYYNSCYEDKIIRILIAHELGHIVNKELLGNKEDSEKTANLFAFIAMDDKNRFYKKECEKFVFKSDVQILNEMLKICPVN